MENLHQGSGQLQRIKELEDEHGFGLVGTYYLDYEKKKVYGDRTLSKLYGIEYKPEGIPLEEFLKNISQEDLEEANRLRDARINNNQPYEIEYRITPAPGEVRWVLARARAKRIDGNLFYEGIVVDITRGKEADIALKNQNKLIKTITDNTSSALFMIDNKGYCTFMNPAAEAMFGYKFDEVKTRLLNDIFRPRSAASGHQQDLFSKAFSGNFSIEVQEDIFYRKDGSTIPVLLSISPIAENDTPASAVIEVRDITSQKEAAALLQRHNEYLEVLNSIGETISEDLEVKGILQKVTDATTQLTGANFGAFFYNTINSSGEAFMLYTLSGAPKEAFDRFGMPRNTAVFRPTFEGEGIVRSANITKDPRYGKNTPNKGMPAGHLPVVSYLAVPVVSKSGVVIGGLFFGHKEEGIFTGEHEKIVAGVAAQAAIALDNAKLYEEVKLLNAKKDEFIGLASHELKTPLTSIRGYLQLLERADIQDRNREFLKKTIKQVNKLSTLVSDLLDVSKIQAGKLTLDISEFNLTDVLLEAKEIVLLSGESHEIILASIPDVQIKADKQRIEQVLINLLTNATKYSPRGKKVIVHAELLQNSVKFSVQDFGIGIEQSQQQKIFSRFFRVEGLNPNISGLGIGLYISSEIVKRHGGEIGVESIPNEGSTFWFSLPV